MSMRFAIVVIASLLITNSLLAGQPGPSKDIPELAPLGNWAGVWSGRIEKPTKQSDSSAGRWIAGGRYLQQTWKVEADADNPAISGTWIMTYDVKKKAYRQWQFNSFGSSAESTGKWNADKRTMTWTRRDAETGVTTVTKAHFPKAGVEQWEMTASDRNGKTIFEMSGQVIRQKD
jgi:hypothetical protein